MYHHKTLANTCLSTKIAHINVIRQNFVNECIPRTVSRINVQNTKLLTCSTVDHYLLRAINESNWQVLSRWKACSPSSTQAPVLSPPTKLTSSIFSRWAFFCPIFLLFVLVLLSSYYLFAFVLLSFCRLSLWPQTLETWIKRSYPSLAISTIR